MKELTFRAFLSKEKTLFMVETLVDGDMVVAQGLSLQEAMLSAARAVESHLVKKQLA